MPRKRSGSTKVPGVIHGDAVGVITQRRWFSSRESLSNESAPE